MTISKTERDLRMTAAAVCLAGLCRLQDLKIKQEQIGGLIIPLTAAEKAELHRLSQWWISIGGEKRESWQRMAYDLSQQVGRE